MISDVQALAPADRAKRLAIEHGKPGHIEDEALVTLVLDARAASNVQDENTYAMALLHRVTKHVRAHVRKNPGWALLGGGSKSIEEDFCQNTVISILLEKDVPCHAEERFGQYVHRRCLDAAGKLYAKKHSAGSSLDDIDEDVDAQAQAGEPAELSAVSKSPEELLIELEEYKKQEDMLEQIRLIVQEHLPERPQIAFTFRYFGEMKIESKKDEVTVTMLMGVTEKTVTKYINQAIKIIRERLEK
jgi:DNA-directed RNA polymerase specialized sigma24 family protein